MYKYAAALALAVGAVAQTITIPAGESIATPYGAPTFSTFQPDASEVAAAAATATSAVFNAPYVPGAAFDRIVHVWLENTDYDKAIGQPDLAALAKKGLILTNYWAVTHPSLPNYLASAGGSYFGADSDRFISMPPYVASIADILDSKGISWGEYQEHMPYSGYEGFQWLNQQSKANDYVRKHNPLILFESVTNDPDRLANIKNFTLFDQDLQNKTLPQWSFVTPNMTNDGHDSNIDVAGKWAARWLTPLLNNTYFTNRTIVVLTFDETAIYTIGNNVLAIVLGDIPDNLRGTTDDTFYTHYSLISTVEANWRLPNLGRGDCGANVFDFVAQQVGYTNTDHYINGSFWNESIIGYLSDSNIPIESPNLTCIGAGGQGVLDSIVKKWDSNLTSGSNSTSNTATTGKPTASTNAANGKSFGAGVAVAGAIAALSFL